MDEVAKYMKALVHLQIASMYPVDPPLKPELVLRNAGFSNPEIADFLGKKTDAVAKAISRAK